MPPESAVVEETKNAPAKNTGSGNPPTTAQELGEAIAGEMRKGLDQRDAALAEKFSKQLEDVVAKIRQDTEARNARHVIPGVGEKEISEFSFARLFVGMASRNMQAVCPFELEMCRAAGALMGKDVTVPIPIVGKDMSTTIDSAGGFIVPTQVMAAQMIPLLQAMAIAPQLGVLNLPCSGSPVEVPKLTGGTTGGWISENVAAPTTEPTFGQIALTPHLYASEVRISLRTINLSSPSVDLIVRRQLARDMGLAKDAVIFNGSGTAGQPTGILQTTGINTVTSFGSASAATAYNKLIDMIKEVALDNALTPGCAWAIDTATWAKLEQMVDATDQPKERRLFGSLPLGESLIGYRYKASTQLPANTILFGDFSQCYDANWGTLILRSSDQAGNLWHKFQVGIQGAFEMDVGVAQPTAFCSALGVS
jgi:HK97 family phage major capsid protein